MKKIHKTFHNIKTLYLNVFLMYSLCDWGECSIFHTRLNYYSNIFYNVMYDVLYVGRYVLDVNKMLYHVINDILYNAMYAVILYVSRYVLYVNKIVYNVINDAFVSKCCCNNDTNKLHRN